MMGKPAKAGKAGYKIPQDEEVQHALYSALHSAETIGSQHELRDMVQRELQKADPAFRVGERRVRMLALRSGYITVDIHTREDDMLKGRLQECPVCGSKISKLKNRTLYGGKVTLGYSCPKCSYSTGLRHKIPVRYIFQKQKVPGQKKAGAPGEFVFRD